MNRVRLSRRNAWVGMLSRTQETEQFGIHSESFYFRYNTMIAQTMVRREFGLVA